MGTLGPKYILYGYMEPLGLNSGLLTVMYPSNLLFR